MERIEVIRDEITNVIKELNLSNLKIFSINQELTRYGGIERIFPQLIKINLSYNYLQEIIIPQYIEEIDLSHNYLTNKIIRNMDGKNISIHKITFSPSTTYPLKTKLINLSDNLFDLYPEDFMMFYFGDLKTIPKLIYDSEDISSPTTSINESTMLNETQRQEGRVEGSSEKIIIFTNNPITYFPLIVNRSSGLNYLQNRNNVINRIPSLSELPKPSWKEWFRKLGNVQIFLQKIINSHPIKSKLEFYFSMVFTIFEEFQTFHHDSITQEEWETRYYPLFIDKVLLLIDNSPESLYCLTKDESTKKKNGFIKNFMRDLNKFLIVDDLKNHIGIFIESMNSIQDYYKYVMASCLLGKYHYSETLNLFTGFLNLIYSPSVSQNQISRKRILCDYYYNDILPTLLLDPSILSYSSYTEMTSHINQITDIRLLYIFGLIDIIANYTKTKNKEQFMKDSNDIISILYSDYTLTKRTPDEYIIKTSKFYMFITQNINRNPYFTRIKEIIRSSDPQKTDSEIFMELTFLTFVNCKKIQTSYYSALFIKISYYSALIKQLPDYIFDYYKSFFVSFLKLTEMFIKYYYFTQMVFLQNPDPDLIDMLQYMGLYENNKTMIGHLSNNNYNDLYDIYISIKRKMEFSNNNETLNSYIFNENNGNNGNRKRNRNANRNEIANRKRNEIKPIEKMLDLSYYINAHGFQLAIPESEEPIYILLNHRYKFHFNTPLMYEGLSNEQFIVGDIGFNRKKEKTLYRKINQYMSYSKGMFCPFILFTFKDEVRKEYWYMGNMLFKNFFKYRSYSFLNETFSIRSRNGKLYFSSFGLLFDTEYYNNLFLYNQNKSLILNTYYENLINKYNEQPELVQFQVSDINDFLDKRGILNNPNTEIYFTSCRKFNQVDMQQEKEQIQNSTIVQFNKEILKVIINLKQKLKIFNKLLQNIENSTLNYNLENINRMTVASLSNKSISKLIQDDGMYDLFELYDFILMECENMKKNKNIDISESVKQIYQIFIIKFIIKKIITILEMK